MSNILNKVMSFFNKEHPTLRKATAITRRKIEPLKNTLRGRQTMGPYTRRRLTGRPFLPRGAEAQRITLQTAIASNQANRLDTARLQSVHKAKTPSKKRFRKSTYM